MKGHQPGYTLNHFFMYVVSQNEWDVTSQDINENSVLLVRILYVSCPDFLFNVVNSAWLHFPIKLCQSDPQTNPRLLLLITQNSYLSSFIFTAKFLILILFFIEVCIHRGMQNKKMSCLLFCF